MPDYNEYNSIVQQSIDALRDETDPKRREQYQSIAQQAMSAMKAIKTQTSEELGGSYNPDTGDWEQPEPTKEPLTIPDTQMYAGKTDQEAQDLYKNYMGSGDTYVPNNFLKFLGVDPVYRGGPEGKPWIIPPPTHDLGDDIGNFISPTADLPESSYVSVGDKISGTIKNTAANVAEFGAAAIDTVADKVSGEENYLGLTEKTQQSMPKLKIGDSMVDTVIMEGVPLVAGAVTGTWVVNGLAKAPTIAKAATHLGPYITTSVKGLSHFIGADLGMTAAADSDVGTLMVGDKAMFDVLEGLNLPADPTQAEIVLTKRANILADALLLSGPLTVTAKGVEHIAGFMKSVIVDPFFRAMNKSKREEVLVQGILDKLQYVTEATNKKEIAEVQRQIVQMIEDNKELVVEMGNKNLDDVVLKFDTMSALQQGLKDGDSELVNELHQKLRMASDKLRKSQVDGSGILTQIKTEQPAQALEDTLGKIEDGGSAINPAKDDLIVSGQALVDSAEANVQAAKGSLQQAEENVAKSIVEDPTMGAKIEQLERLTDINIYADKNTSMDTIVSGVRSAYETMKKRKDDLYMAVQGGSLEPSVVLNMFKKMDDEHMAALGKALPPNSPMRGLVSESRLRYDNVLQPDGKTVTRVPEAPEIREARVAEYLAANNIDFGFMYREIRPALAEAGSILYTAGDVAARQAGKVTKDWVRYIDGDLLDWVAKNSDPETAKNAMIAKDYYMREFQPFWNDGALGDVADLHNATVGRTNAGMKSSGLEIQPVNFEQGAVNTLGGALTEGNRKQADHLISLLETGNTSVNPKVVTDYVIADVLADISTTVRGQGIDALDIGQINATLAKYGSVLENFPEESARILDFMESIKAANNNVAAKKALVEQAEQAAKVTKDAIYEDALKGFFKSLPNSKVAVPNGYAVFQKILLDPQGADQLEMLVEIAKQSDNPLILEGMQQAFARTVKSRAIGSTREVAGSRALNLGQATKMTDDQTSELLKHGDIIFQDKPEIMSGIRSIMGVTKGVAIGKRARPFAGASNTAFSQQAQRTADRIVLSVIGPLTRLGARVHAGVSTTLSRVAADEAAAMTLDLIMSDPEEFVRIARRIQKKPVIDHETRNMIFKWMVRTGIYNTGDEMDWVNTLAQAELEVRDLTDEAFGQ